VSRALLLIPLAAAAVALAGFAQPRDPSDGRFTNLDGTRPPQGFGSLLRWKLWDRLTGKNRQAPDRVDLPTTAPDLALLARPPGVGERARVTWLGHAGFLVQLDGVSLLVDPALKPSIFGGVRRNLPPGVAIDQLPPIDAVLITHSHYDHLDLPTLEAVKAPVVAGLGLERWFRDRGLFATELGWWSTTTVRGVKITFVPAQHWSARGLFDRNETLWGGFVIQGSAATIYHSGDTASFAGFKEIGARFPGIDAALLPIGAYDPEWFMLSQHMNPEQAVQAFLDLGARTMVAMHWGTFKLTDEPLDEPPARLDAEARRLHLPVTAVRIPAVGQTIAFGRGGALRASAKPAPAAAPRAGE
jgi:L-ascorbate metabolism protein UlaG (beta-lactamase superfamily)